ncbi:proteasome assembly chaperone 1-like isoform X1 [Argopecten irradians]|uniref:proteasome assembly chaperone 1-like isoform X1 n=2 Tax=Argopecten irradians TaxID=31199 RepID=UPI00371DCCB0
MATFFGEILPVSSRAVDDDEDEDDDLEPFDCDLWMRWSEKAKAEMKATEDGKLECHTLIIAIGPAPTGFARAYILHQEFELLGGLFGGIKEHDFNTFQQTSPTDKTCYLYRSTQNRHVMVCQCNVDITPEQSYSFATKLFAGISMKMNYISILCSCPTSEYKTDIPILDMQPPFLRALKSAKFAGTPLCPYVEQPNVIAGLPAQLLSTCQIHGYRAVLYCCIHVLTGPVTVLSTCQIHGYRAVLYCCIHVLTGPVTILSTCQIHGFRAVLYCCIHVLTGPVQY